MRSSRAPANASPPPLLPAKATLAQYRELFVRLDLGRSFVNSTVLALCAALLSVVVNAAAGYAFAKLRFPARGRLFTGLLAAMVIPGQVAMLPVFLLLRSMGLVNSFAGVILPGIASIFGIFLVRQFASSVPDELLDAARIDGAGELRIFWSMKYRTTRLTTKTTISRTKQMISLRYVTERMVLVRTQSPNSPLTALSKKSMFSEILCPAIVAPLMAADSAGSIWGTLSVPLIVRTIGTSAREEATGAPRPDIGKTSQRVTSTAMRLFKTRILVFGDMESPPERTPSFAEGMFCHKRTCISRPSKNVAVLDFDRHATH